MKEMLKKLKDLESEMEEAENQTEYWLQAEHFDIAKSENYGTESDRLYVEVNRIRNIVADFIVNLTYCQINKIMALNMIMQRRADVEKLLTGL